MPQSLASIPVHFIWSTKDRQPFIRPENVITPRWGFLILMTHSIPGRCPSLFHVAPSGLGGATRDAAEKYANKLQYLAE